MAKCPHCGAEFSFNAKTQKVHCEYCGSEFNPQELETKTKSAKAKEDELKGKSYTCTQCGATLMTFDETAITFCSYCGSQNMIEDKMMHQTAPEFIIPFSKTQDECVANYKKKINSFLFCPSYMKSDVVVKKFRGIYMPYGIYRLTYDGDCINKGKKYNHRSGDYIYYDDYDIHADVKASYDGISYDLVSKYYDDYSHAIPFNYKEAVPFNSNYLSGFYADTKDVDIGTYSSNAIEIGSDDSTHYLRKNHTYAKYDCSHPKVNFHVGEKKVAMFPVYFLAIRDKADKNIHYAVINGQTGKVAMDLPIDFWKYILCSVILAIPIYFGLMILPVVLPFVINIFSIIAAIIAFFMCYSQAAGCQARETRYYDKGVLNALKQTQTEEEHKQFKKDQKKKKKPVLKFSYIWKYLAAIGISLVPIFLKPVNDMYYYGAAMISLILILWSFYELIQLHNRLVSTPIPQLEKRGGDEHE